MDSYGCHNLLQRIESKSSLRLPSPKQTCAGKETSHSEYPRILVRYTSVMDDSLAPDTVESPSATILLCIWHIEKNVVAKCKPNFTGRDVDEWKAFAKDWRSVRCLYFSEIDNVYTCSFIF